jgi:PIN domain nuclease of toxin-antitoxin system
VRVLLDTQALVWYAFADPQLATTARAIIADPANEVLVSPASYWEIAIKVSLGKWQLHQPYPDLIDSLWTVYGFRILPITPEHTGRLIGLPFHHRDPFDRLLAAQALVEGVPRVSSDVVFEQYGVTRVWN